MTKRLLPENREHALGTLGLLLMLLVAKLAECAHPSQQTYLQRARAFLARRAIDGIAVIGWLVDRLPDQAIRTVRESAVVGNRPCVTR
jgi:hypothetical protein